MTPLDYSRQTTLITGASSGIGVEFARHLARRGSDVVLVARRQDRLEALAAELQTAYGVRAVPVALDLSAPHAGRVLAAEVDRRGLTVTSLINNAGFGADGPFHEQDPDRLRDLVNLNVAGLVDVTRAFIGSLRAADHGVLINIASMAAYQPIPSMAVYAASKAFVLSFTEALWGEARGTGLRVMSAAPGLTRTEFFDAQGSAAYRGRYQTPDQVVENVLRAIERSDPPPSMISGRSNSLGAALVRLLSRRRVVLVAARAGASSMPPARDKVVTGAGSTRHQ